MKFKTLFLIILFTSMTFGQSSWWWAWGGDDFQGIYDGDERILNAIDRGMEVGDELAAPPYNANANWVDNGDGSYTAQAGTGDLRPSTTRSVTGTAQYKQSITVAGRTQGAVYVLYNGSINPLIISSDGDHQNFVVYSTNTTMSYIASPTGNFNGTISNISFREHPALKNNGNHTADSSTAQKNAGTYSTAITATGAGSSTTNFISLPSARFTAVESGKQYRFSIYAYTTTASTTLTFNLGDITLSETVSTTGFTKLDFDFKATASTTGNIKLYLDKAATVYVDDASLKQGR